MPKPWTLGHGTEARARKHRRDGQKPCEICLAAEREASWRRHQVTGWRRTRLSAADARIERILAEIYGDLTITGNTHVKGVIGQVPSSDP